MPNMMTQRQTTPVLMRKAGNCGDPSLIVARGLLFARGDLTTKKILIILITIN